MNRLETRKPEGGKAGKPESRKAREPEGWRAGFRVVWFSGFPAFLAGIYSQTPVFRGEDKDRLEEAKQIVLRLLRSEMFFLAILGIGIVIGLIILYNRKKAISELDDIQVVQEDTWFATRDDNNRIGIVVSVSLSNKATRGIHITDCKLSGYSAKEYPEEIYLKDTKGEQKVNFPEHKHFYKGQEFYLGPYSSETLWFYYESRAVTMRNVLEAPLTIRDSTKRRRSIRVRIPRHADQIAIYREMAKMW
jgi:hypothetical protein